LVPPRLKLQTIRTKAIAIFLADLHDVFQGMEASLVGFAISHHVWRLHGELAHEMRIESGHFRRREQLSEILDQATLHGQHGDVIKECLQGNL
jgi:hypothetical protein